MYRKNERYFRIYDEFRDGLKGSTFDEQEPGYASGNINGHFEPVKYGIVGGTQHPQVDYSGLLLL